MYCELYMSGSYLLISTYRTCTYIMYNTLSQYGCNHRVDCHRSRISSTSQTPGKGILHVSILYLDIMFRKSKNKACMFFIQSEALFYILLLSFLLFSERWLQLNAQTKVKCTEWEWRGWLFRQGVIKKTYCRNWKGILT